MGKLSSFNFLILYGPFYFVEVPNCSYSLPMFLLKGLLDQKGKLQERLPLRLPLWKQTAIGAIHFMATLFIIPNLLFHTAFITVLFCSISFLLSYAVLHRHQHEIKIDQKHVAGEDGTARSA